MHRLHLHPSVNFLCVDLATWLTWAAVGTRTTQPCTDSNLQRAMVAYFPKQVLLQTRQPLQVDGGRSFSGHDSRYGCGSKCKVWIKPRSHKRSRPLIQTPDPDLSKGVDPDLWNDIIYGRVDVCSYSTCQAAKQQTVLKPRCQAVKLLSCTCCKATLPSCQTATVVKQPSCQAVKLQLLHIQAVKLTGCQAAKLSICCLLTLSSFSCHSASKADPDPDPDRSRPDPDHNQLRVSPS